MDTIIGNDVISKRYRRFGLHNLRSSFRSWRRSRPFWAGMTALAGGLPMWYFPSKAVQFLFVSRTPIWAGILVGVLVEMFAILLWAQPNHRTLYGLLIVILSLLSFITSDFGGLFIGMFLGILGGSLALAWTPVMGKTRRQQKWLLKTRGEEPREASAAATTEVAGRVVVLDEPAAAGTGTIELDEETFEPEPIVDRALTVTEPTAGSGIDRTGAEGRSERTEASVEMEAKSIDLRDEDLTIDVRDEPGGSASIDLREEKATTAPPSSVDGSAIDDKPQG